MFIIEAASLHLSVQSQQRMGQPKSTSYGIQTHQGFSVKNRSLARSSLEILDPHAQFLHIIRFRSHISGMANFTLSHTVEAKFKMALFLSSEFWRGQVLDFCRIENLYNLFGNKYYTIIFTTLCWGMNLKFRVCRNYFVDPDI